MAAESDQREEHGPEVQEGSAEGEWDRRKFLVRAAVLGLSSSTLLALVQACATGGSPVVSPTSPLLPSPSPGVTPTATLAATSTPTAMPRATLTPAPSATPVPRPTATRTPRPTATPSPTPNPTATSSPTPRPVPEPDPDRVRMGHLLRRAGFGESQSEMERFLAMGMPAAIDYLIEYQDVDDSELEQRLEGLALDVERSNNLQRWWLLRMIYSKRPLQEKMVLFWHGILTSSIAKAGQGPAMFDQNQLFRGLALGSFDVLLKAISRDPAMLIWLDSQSNVKSAPNENYARELMELFTLGVGNYSETDVRESARAFTGWGLRRREFEFRSFQHDFGSKTFLGRTGDFDGDDITDIILEQPAAAEFITRKLFAFFAYDDPEPETVAALTATFKDSRYSIKAVMRQIFNSAEFFSERAYRAKVKSPAELVAGIIRTLGIEMDGRVLPGAVSSMGQTLFAPFDVSGWPGGAAWITTTTLLQRLNFANSVASGRSRALLFNPGQLLQGQGVSSLDAAVDYFVTLLLDGGLSREQRETALAYLEGGSPLGGSRTNLVADEKVRSLVYFILGSPEYQLA